VAGKCERVCDLPHRTVRKCEKIARRIGPLELWFAKTWRPGDIEPVSDDYRESLIGKVAGRVAKIADCR
jgi:hypothetical protein